MPARDILHDVVKEALIHDGWIITHDPFTIAFGIRKVYADLGAERLLAAQKDESKVVVEVKSFLGMSRMADLERALGQYLIYRSWLKRTNPDYKLYVAVNEVAYKALFLDISGRVLMEDYNIGCGRRHKKGGHRVDRLEQHRTLVKRLLTAEAAIKPANEQIEAHLVFDDEHSSYQLMYIGWQGSWRMHGVVIHVRLHNGKIWIEEDGTEESFAGKLLAAGIPKAEIVLGFHAPWERQFTDFAIA
jgi:hypothetical protein